MQNDCRAQIAKYTRKLNRSFYDINRLLLHNRISAQDQSLRVHGLLFGVAGRLSIFGINLGKHMWQKYISY